MRIRKTIAIFAALLLGAAILLPVAASTPRQWYADKLEKLGFFVFDEPYVMKDFSVETLSGGKASRLVAKGNVVLLNFWASWCPPCKEEMPGIEKLSKAMKGKKFEVMAVNLGDSRTTVQNFLKENGYSFPVYLDQKGTLSDAYASNGIPTTYILDKSGRFIAGIIGGIRYDSPEVLAVMAELAAK
ncbi:MAG: TlpA disulfide reductase family protein [Rectinemataceae bacterium]